MAEGSNREWVGTSLVANYVDSRGVEQMVVKFDEGEEVLTPRFNEVFGSYDLYEAAAYIGFPGGHIHRGRD